MVEIIYDQLKIPKSIEELYQRLNESGIKWNKAQIKLFLQLDSNIKKNGDLYSIARKALDAAILDVIDNIMEGKPMAPIKKIMDHMPKDIMVSVEEISKIAEQSGKYKLHPNGAVLTRVQQ